MKKVFLIVMISMFTLNAQSQVQKENNPEGLIKEFFKKYKSTPDAALEYIFSTNPWMKESQAQVEGLNLRLKNLIQIIGKYHSEKLITKASVASDLVMYSYLIKYDRQPLRFVFTFYKPNSSWRLLNFKFDDELDNELDEAIKAYRLRENLPAY